MDIQLHLCTYTDQQLLELLAEMQKLTIPEDSPLRKLIAKCFPVEGIFILQVQQLIWPMLQVIASRFASYSPHIEAEHKNQELTILQRIKSQPNMVIKMYRAIDQFINCDHQEHLITRLNDPETEAMLQMKKILETLHK